MTASGDKVFISYCKEKEALARKIAACLEGEGYPTFLAPRDMDSSSWPSRLRDELKSNPLLLAIVTDGYFDDRWSKAEFDTALVSDPHGSKGRICIVRVDKAPIQDFDSRLDPIEATEDHIETHFDKIKSRVRRCMERWREHCGATSPAEPPLKVAPTQEAVEEYKRYLRSEYANVCRRFLSPEATSRTSQIVYGWHAAGGDMHPERSAVRASNNRPLPYIANMLAERIIRSFSSNSLLPRSTTSLADLVTLRYYMFCMIVQVASHDFDVEHVISSLANVPDSIDMIEVRNQISVITNLLAELRDYHSYLINKPIALKFSTALARIAAGLDFSIKDILSEERSGWRASQTQAERSGIDRENRVTHLIEVYFEDRARNYFLIFSELQKIDFNLIRTVSETLSPTKVAKVTLWVCYIGEDLERRVKQSIDRDRNVRDMVLHLVVKYLHDS